MNRGEECCTHVLIRGAITSAGGIVPPGQVLAAMGHAEPSPALPSWVADWIAAETGRPWPPNL